MRHVVLTSAFAICGLAGPLSAQSAPIMRPATCVEGLHEYPDLKDVPAPYDTVKARPIGGGTASVNGLTRIDDLDEFHKSLLRGAAAAGATGWVSFRAGSDQGNGNTQRIGRTLPVFVASDSARAHSACAAKAKAPL